MKITCQKTDLAKALSRARSIGAHKTPMPILNSVLLKKVGAGHLRIAATDIELGYTSTVAAKIEGEDLVAVHAGDLMDRVKAMPDGEIKLEATARSVVLTAKGSKRRFERSAHDGAEFPLLPTMTDGVGFDGIESMVLLTMLEAAHFAVGDDPSNATTNSMLLRWSPGRLIMAAADGRRMSIEERVIDTIKSTGETMLPARAVAELRKMLDTEGPVNVVVTDRNTFLDFGDYEFSCRRPDAKFPPYESFPAKRIDAPMRLTVAPTIESIGAVGLAAGRGDMSQNLTFAWKGGECVLSAESSDKGVARDSLVAEWSGPDFSLNVNGQYFREALTAAGSEAVAISVDPTDDLWPIRVDPWEPQAGRAHYGIVMPARK